MFLAGMVVQRVIRKSVKDIQREGEAFDDEDAMCVRTVIITLCMLMPTFLFCSYERSNIHRSWYENVEIDQARSWQQALATRRATQAAQRALKDPSKLVLEEEFNEFVEDVDLFRRGAENPYIYHMRRIGRLSVGTPKGSPAAARTRSAMSAVSEEEDQCILPPLGAAHVPPVLLPHGAGDPPGSFANPLRATAHEEYVQAHSELSSIDSDDKRKQTPSRTGKKRARVEYETDGYTSTAEDAGPASAAAANTAEFADSAGGNIYVKFRLSGKPLQAATAHLGCDYLAPSRGTHRRACRLCAPSLLQGVTYGRKGVDGLEVKAESKIREAEVLIPRFRELSSLHLQGIRYDDPVDFEPAVNHSSAGRSKTTPTRETQQSSALSSPVIVLGLDAPTESKGNPKLFRLNKLARQLGTVIALDRGVVEPAVPAPENGKSLPVKSLPHKRPLQSKGAEKVKETVSDKGKSAVRAPPLDPALDTSGYDAKISSIFATNYYQKKFTINNHPDSIVTLARLAALKHRKTSTSRAAGANSVSTASSTATAESSEETPIVVDDFKLDRWLIRRRLHYCETHASDVPEVRPVVPDFTDSSKPYAPLLLQSLTDSDPAAYVLPPPTPAGASRLATVADDDDVGFENPFVQRTGRRMAGRPPPEPLTSGLAIGAVKVASALLKGTPVSPETLAMAVISPRGKIPKHGEAAYKQVSAMAAASFNPTQLGAIVDAKASTGGWWLAQIVDVRDHEAGLEDNQKEIRVHYQGWSEDFDEWVSAPAPDVLEVFITGSTPKTAALRSAVASSRVAPAMSHSSVGVAVCHGCNNRKTGDLLFCDHVKCGKAYHIQCLKTPLVKIPTGAWVCPSHEGTPDPKLIKPKRS
jgi:hypothetical protein